MPITKGPKRFCGESCTLDGRPAIIVGRKLPFARVRTTDGNTRVVVDGDNPGNEAEVSQRPLDVEFSWATVERIMTTKNGAFSS